MHHKRPGTPAPRRASDYEPLPLTISEEKFATLLAEARADMNVDNSAQHAIHQALEQFIRDLIYMASVAASLDHRTEITRRDVRLAARIMGHQ